MLIDARGYLFEVSDGATPTPAWLSISGVTEFELNPSEGEEIEDTTLFSNQGYMSSEPMQRGATLTIKGKKVAESDGDPDPGQLRVDTLGGLVSTAAVGELRFRHTIEDSWTVWDTWVTPGSTSGGNNNKVAWSAVFHRNGAATTAVVS